MEATVVRPAYLIALCAALLAAWPAVSTAQAQQSTRQCTPKAALVELARLTEASGLAASQRTPGRLWTHNDSGQPVLFALDNRGAVTGQVRVGGAKVEDWEAIAVGPCETGSCIYIGDIGDNDAKRRRITIYRVPEPEQASGTVKVADVLHASYPDGAHDAETLLVAAGRLYVVTKGSTGPMAIYGFPARLQPGTTMKLERLGEASLKADDASRITDGSVSPDGRTVVLRSRSALTFYDPADLLAGRWRAVSTVAVTPIKEPQGEGVVLGADNVVFLAGEGGGKKRPGTFARFSCAAAGS